MVRLPYEAWHRPRAPSLVQPARPFPAVMASSLWAEVGPAGARDWLTAAGALAQP